MTDDPLERLGAERDRAITDACAEASSVMRRMMRDFSMRPEEAAQAVLDFYSASFAEGQCVHGRALTEHGWADCVECEAGDPEGTLPSGVEPGVPEGPGVHVTIDVTAWGDDPEQTVRDWIAGSSVPEDVFIDDIFADGPE